MVEKRPGRRSLRAFHFGDRMGETRAALERHESIQRVELERPSGAGAVITTPMAMKSEDAQAAVLAEVLDLLEDYGPLWYTENLHDRMVTAILELSRSTYADY